MTISTIEARLADDGITVGRFFSVDFQRTIRLPDDGRKYPLPPGLGRFDLRAVADYSTKIPASWRGTGGFFLPMHRHEALWLAFAGQYWHPVAVRVDAGGVCALTGAQHAAGLSADPQNYMVVPEQPWLDGIKAGEGIIRQFVAAPLGEGTTIEGQVTGEETTGGIQITVVDAKPGVFPMTAPQRTARDYDGSDGSYSSAMSYMVCESVTPMGLGAGGRMVQKIYPDEHGIDTWDIASAKTIDIHLVDARDWRSITGEPMPPSPIPVDAYKKLGGPWFALLDDDMADLPVSPILAGVKPVPFD